ncbi:hypothetical protein EDC04DRAFT_2549647, partial [Pisolithus marmoratus]
RFGTLRPMKRVEVTQLVAFPIGNDTVTFKRDLTCSVMLCYTAVSPVHSGQNKVQFFKSCKSGIHGDGCPVLRSQNLRLPTTTPV